MNLPISPGELMTAVAAMVGVGVSYGDFRARLQGHKAQTAGQFKTLTDRVETLEAEVKELKEGQLAVALLEQAMSRFEDTARSLNTEAQATRTAMIEMGKTLVRIETRMNLEGATPRGAR